MTIGLADFRHEVVFADPATGVAGRKALRASAALRFSRAAFVGRPCPLLRLRGSGSRRPRRKEQERWPTTSTRSSNSFHYHLVLAEDGDERADANLARLAGEIERMATQPLWRPTEWIFCDDCGRAVDMELIDPDGHHYADDGDFYCVDCWQAEP